MTVKCALSAHTQSATSKHINTKLPLLLLTHVTLPTFSPPKDRLILFCVQNKYNIKLGAGDDGLWLGQGGLGWGLDGGPLTKAVCACLVRRKEACTPSPQPAASYQGHPALRLAFVCRGKLQTETGCVHYGKPFNNMYDPVICNKCALLLLRICFQYFQILKKASTYESWRAHT